MSYMQDEILWLVWKKEDKTFKVGELHRRRGKYYFKYDVKGVERASEYNFRLLPYLPKVDAEYFREELFRSFAERIPSKEKRNIDEVLRQHDVEEYDEFELLKKTGGKSEYDNLEFVVPDELVDNL